jgi:cell wall assembly regulator SMI1
LAKTANEPLPTRRATRFEPSTAAAFAARRRIDNVGVDDAFLVARSWSRIERWLAEHAPVSYGQLNPPAEGSAIAEAERALGVAFPPSLVTLLGLHDGVDDWKDGAYVLRAKFLPGNYRLLPLADIVRHSRMLTEIVLLSEEQVGWWWHPSWVPFADAVWAGCLYTDQRDGGEGSVGDQAADGGASPDRWPSLAVMLTQFADAVEAGGCVGDYRPRVIDGGLEWEDTFAPSYSPPRNARLDAFGAPRSEPYRD